MQCLGPTPTLIRAWTTFVKHQCLETPTQRPSSRLSLHRLCSTCTPTTCHLHVAETSFTLTTCLAIQGQFFSEPEYSLVRYGADLTLVDSGDLNQAPPKQSAVCSTCIIPAPPVNCQFIWMASAFGMSATQPIDCRLLELSSRVTLDRTLSYRTETTC